VPLPRGLPIVDHHCHLSPTGEGVAAAARFRSAGGTHLFLATQNYSPAVPRSLDAYRVQFETTERLARSVQEQTGVVVFTVLAPYPLDLLGASAEIGLGEALALQRDALELAGRWIRERRAVALGEVGRAHFPVDAPVTEAIETVFRHALSVAHDVGCPVVVHSEDLDAAGFRYLATVARGAGLAPERVVKHYARSYVPAAEREGVAASYLARRDTVRDTLGDGPAWFLETDFLDDPHRPGAVLDLTTVPRRARAIADASPERIDALRIPFSESPKRLYGLELEVPEGLGA
jgi:TatD-related deoxyribonuclease